MTEIQNHLQWRFERVPQFFQNFRHVTLHASLWYCSFKHSTCIIKGSPSHSLWVTAYYRSVRFAWQNFYQYYAFHPRALQDINFETQFPWTVFRLISMESLDQRVTPLGNYMPIYVNFLETGNGYADRNRKVFYGILGDLQQTYFTLGTPLIG